MNAPPPKKSMLSFDLFALPGLSSYVAKWRDLTVANLAVRREAKSLLFHDLAAATSAGIPLVEALGLVSQTLGENWRESRTGRRQGADRRFTAAMAALIVGTLINLLTFVIFMIMSPVLADPDRVARLLALRLEKITSGGSPLSDAMQAYPADYSPAEVAIIRYAEDAGRLSSGLQHLADFQVMNRRQLATNGFLLYPLGIALVCSFIIGFILVKIVPKFEDIFHQVGAEFSGPMLSLVDLFRGDVLHLILYLVFAPMLLLFVTRLLLNGSSLAKWMLIPVLAPICYVLAHVAVYLAYIVLAKASIRLGVQQWPLFSPPMEHRLAITLVAAGLTIAFLPAFIGAIERRLTGIEELLGRMLSRIPFLATAARAERELRWLAGFSLMLDSRIPESLALLRAGAGCGRKMADASERAAIMVEQGLPLGIAIERSAVLSHRLAARTSFACGCLDVHKRLREIAEEQAVLATEAGARATRVAELVGVVAIGFVVLLIVTAVYLPIFSFPIVAAGEQ